MASYIPNSPARLPDDLCIWVRKMRHTMTDAEALLWRWRKRHVAGAKFRRQHPIGRYILDFYCDEKQLALEVDGGQHTDSALYDERRDAWLCAKRIEVLRLWNNQVLTETEAVMETIYRALTSDRSNDLPHPQPLSRLRERGVKCVTSSG